MRSEFRRVILAFAAPASFPLAGFRSAFDAFALPGIIGIGAADGYAVGCIFMGPVVGFLDGIRNNSVVPKLFKLVIRRRSPLNSQAAAQNTTKINHPALPDGVRMRSETVVRRASYLSGAILIWNNYELQTA